MLINNKLCYYLIGLNLPMKKGFKLTLKCPGLAKLSKELLDVFASASAIWEENKGFLYCFGR